MSNWKEEIIWERNTVSKQQMLDRIYEVIADKTLSFGCKLSSPKWIFVEWMDSKKEIFTYYDVWLDNIWLGNNSRYRHRRSDTKLWKEIRVIWHPVMIGDVLERIRWDKRDELCKMCDDIYNLYIWVMKVWKDKRKSINEQSEDCIKLIYSFCQ